MNNTVSIIVPAYNAEKTIGECISSITNQTYRNIEVIIVDDGSNDKTLEISNSLRNQDSRIIVLSQNNSGPSSARNAGIAISKGDFLMFVDSDDWIEKECVMKAVNTIIKDNSDLVLWNIVLDKTKSSKKMLPIPGEDRILDSNAIDKIMKMVLSYKSEIPGMLNISITGPVCKLFRRSVVGTNRFPVNLSMGEDLYFLLTLLPKTHTISYIADCLYHVVSCNESLSQKFDENYAYRKADFVNSILGLIADNKQYKECIDKFIYYNYLTVTEKYLFYGNGYSYKNRVHFIKSFCDKLNYGINYKRINHKCSFFLKHNIFFPIYIIGKMSTKYK